MGAVSSIHGICGSHEASAPQICSPLATTTCWYIHIHHVYIVCLTLLASFFLPSHLSLKHVHVSCWSALSRVWSVECCGFKSHPRQLIFLRKVTALGVLCCFVVYMTLLASFFLPSASLIYMYVIVHVHTRPCNIMHTYYYTIVQIHIEGGVACCRGPRARLAHSQRLPVAPAECRNSPGRPDTPASTRDCSDPHTHTHTAWPWHITRCMAVGSVTMSLCAHFILWYYICCYRTAV